MIKFFRNIRQTLLQEGRSSSYLKYAIGEIVLVVIGILIALQINNWNEQRKDNIKENHIVKSLYDEFIDNYHYIEERKQQLSNKTEESDLVLLRLCNEKHSGISADSLLTLTYSTFIGGSAYSPKTSTFKRVINNEEFNLIQQDSLKTLLNQYHSVLDFTYTTNQLLFDSKKNFWMYAQDKFGGILLGKKSNFPIHKHLFDSIPDPKASFNPDDIISDIAFQNILTKELLSYGFTLYRLNELQELNQTLRDYIDRHYKI